MFAIFLTCAGCNRNDNASLNIQETETAKGQVSDEEVSIFKGGKFTVPRTRKDEKELFGVTDGSGRWIPPQGSHTDPRTRNTYNKEGVVIGGTYNPEIEGVG